uniref:hypothetical protein n=1 Tax=Streptomyces caniscabiei TaxID=2746961 RepID=UPI00117E5D5A
MGEDDGVGAVRADEGDLVAEDQGGENGVAVPGEGEVVDSGESRRPGLILPAEPSRRAGSDQ